MVRATPDLSPRGRLGEGAGARAKREAGKSNGGSGFGNFERWMLIEVAANFKPGSVTSWSRTQLQWYAAMLRWKATLPASSPAVLPTSLCCAFQQDSLDFASIIEFYSQIHSRTCPHVGAFLSGTS